MSSGQHINQELANSSESETEFAFGLCQKVMNQVNPNTEEYENFLTSHSWTHERLVLFLKSKSIVEEIEKRRVSFLETFDSTTASVVESIVCGGFSDEAGVKAELLLQASDGKSKYHCHTGITVKAIRRLIEMRDSGVSVRKLKEEYKNLKDNGIATPHPNNLTKRMAVFDGGKIYLRQETKGYATWALDPGIEWLYQYAVATARYIFDMTGSYPSDITALAKFATYFLKYRIQDFELLDRTKLVHNLALRSGNRAYLANPVCAIQAPPSRTTNHNSSDGNTTSKKSKASPANANHHNSVKVASNRLKLPPQIGKSTHGPSIRAETATCFPRAEGEPVSSATLPPLPGIQPNSLSHATAKSEGFQKTASATRPLPLEPHSCRGPSPSQQSSRTIAGLPSQEKLTTQPGTESEVRHLKAALQKSEEEKDVLRSELVGHLKAALQKSEEEKDALRSQLAKLQEEYQKFQSGQRGDEEVNVQSSLPGRNDNSQTSYKQDSTGDECDYQKLADDLQWELDSIRVKLSTIIKKNTCSSDDDDYFEEYPVEDLVDEALLCDPGNSRREIADLRQRMWLFVKTSRDLSGPILEHDCSLDALLDEVLNRAHGERYQMEIAHSQELAKMSGPLIFEKLDRMKIAHEKELVRVKQEYSTRLEDFVSVTTKELATYRSMALSTGERIREHVETKKVLEARLASLRTEWCELSSGVQAEDDNASSG